MRRRRRLCLAGGGLFGAAGLGLRIAARAVPGFADAYIDHVMAFRVQTLGRLSSLCPRSLAELLICAAILLLPVFLLALAVFAAGRGRNRKLGRGLSRAGAVLVLFAGVIFFLYEGGEDAGFFTTSMTERYGLMRGAYTDEELAEVCSLLVDLCNKAAVQTGGSGKAGWREDTAAAAGSAGEEGDAVVDRREEAGESEAGEDGGSEGCLAEEAKLAESGSEGRTGSTETAEQKAREAVSALGGEFPEFRGYVPYPKPVLLSSLMSRAGLAGIWTAFTLEANYNAEMPAYSRPFAMCHELSHAKGILRENEANFFAWLACAESEEAELCRSAAYTAWVYCGNELYRRDHETWRMLYSQLDEAVREELLANTAYWKSYEGRTMERAEHLNDAYLKGKGVTSGSGSYDEVTDLIVTRLLSTDSDKEGSKKSVKY